MIPSRLTWIAAGLLVGAGVWVLAMLAAGRGDLFDKRPRSARAKSVTGEPVTAKQLVGGFAGAGLIYFVTSWWAVFPIVMVGTVLFSGKFPKRAAASQDMAAGEALASWAERVRDAVQAGTGLVSAFHAAARSCAPQIAEHATELAERAGESGISPALVQFSGRIGLGSADSLVMAMIVAEQRGGRELVSLLTSEIEAIRHELAIEREESGIRQRYRTAVRIIIVTMGISMIGYRMLSPTFMAPYNSFTGQVVLLVLGAIMLAALSRIVRLSRRLVRERLFDPELLAQGNAS
jgi:tight adherence protein B